MSRVPDAGEWIVPDGLPADAVRAVSTTRGSPQIQALVPLPLLKLRQVHGSEVVTVNASSRDAWLAQPPQADAAVTRLHDVALCIRTADCLPVLLADEQGTVVGAAHAGWRGLAAGVLEATLQAMQAEPASVRAWIGPGIGPAAFEVGDDVLDAFVRVEPTDRSAFSARSPGKWLADLPRLARARLQRAGVRHVAGGTWCTFSDASRFHSWRRDRATERMTTSMWRRADRHAR